jgi:hypothetical protein
MVVEISDPVVFAWQGRGLLLRLGESVFSSRAKPPSAIHGWNVKAARGWKKRKQKDGGQLVRVFTLAKRGGSD